MKSNITKNQKIYLVMNLFILFIVIASVVLNLSLGKVNASTQEPADINNDNVVNGLDVSILLPNWAKTGSSTSDINSDSVVNVFDLSMLLSKWGPVGSTARYEQIVQAEAFSINNGVQVESTSDIDGGQAIGYVSDGDSVTYSSANFASPVVNISIRVASSSGTGGNIEVHSGNATGALLATLPVVSTGGWQSWTTINHNLLSPLSGNATFSLVFRANTPGADFVNVNWMRFDNGVVLPPVANAGADQSIYTSTTAVLDGSRSSDPDGRTMSYNWVQTAGTAVTLTNPNSSSPSFTPPGVGSYTFLLTVNNGAYSSTDSVTVVVKDSATIQPMPTRANTGPRYALTDITPAQFFSTRTCNRQRIVGDLGINQASMRGLTFNFTDCEITGTISVYVINNNQQLPEPDMPVININYTDVLGGIYSENAHKLNIDHSYVGSKIQLKIADGNYGDLNNWPLNVPGYTPYVFSNSMIYNIYISAPSHTETLQTAGLGTGASFTNVAFVQQGGPLATTGVTSTINYQGDGTIFDGCYFLWDGEPAAFFTAYISGPGVIVRNSWFDTSATGYVRGFAPAITPTYQYNRNYRTGQPINLP